MLKFDVGGEIISVNKCDIDLFPECSLLYWYEEHDFIDLDPAWVYPLFSNLGKYYANIRDPAASPCEKKLEDTLSFESSDEACSQTGSVSSSDDVLVVRKLTSYVGANNFPSIKLKRSSAKNRFDVDSSQHRNGMGSMSKQFSEKAKMLLKCEESRGLLEGKSDEYLPYYYWWGSREEDEVGIFLAMEYFNLHKKLSIDKYYECKVRKAMEVCFSGATQVEWQHVPNFSVSNDFKTIQWIKDYIILFTSKKQTYFYMDVFGDSLRSGELSGYIVDISGSTTIITAVKLRSCSCGTSGLNFITSEKETQDPPSSVPVTLCTNCSLRNLTQGKEYEIYVWKWLKPSLQQRACNCNNYVLSTDIAMNLIPYSSVDRKLEQDIVRILCKDSNVPIVVHRGLFNYCGNNLLYQKYCGSKWHSEVQQTMADNGYVTENFSYFSFSKLVNVLRMRRIVSDKQYTGNWASYVPSSITHFHKKEMEDLLNSYGINSRVLSGPIGQSNGYQVPLWSSNRCV